MPRKKKDLTETLANLSDATMDAVKEAEKAIKETSRKATAALVPEVFVQWNGREAGCAELVEKAKADFKAQNKGAIRSCKLYIKPEDGAAYYVINGKSGKIDL